MAGSTVLAVTSNCASRTPPRLPPLRAGNTYLYFYPCGDPHRHNTFFGPKTQQCLVSGDYTTTNPEELGRCVTCNYKQNECANKLCVLTAVFKKEGSPKKTYVIML